MQSDSPESEPRLQKANPGPKVATGFVDPCLVYLETTLPGEIPLLIALFASSSRESRGSDNKTRFELGNGLIICSWYAVKGFELPVIYCSVNATLTADRDAFILETVPFKCFLKDSPKDLLPQSTVKLRFQTAVRYLDEPAVRTVMRPAPLPSNLKTQALFAKKLLELAEVNWPSIGDALTALKRHKVLKERTRKSLFRRLVSSVFQKKLKPVAV